MRVVVFIFFVSLAVFTDSVFAQAYYSNDSTEEGKSSIYTRVVDLESQIREMRGKIEQMEFMHKQLIAKLHNVVDDVNYRFDKLEKSPGGDEKIKDLPYYIALFSEGKLAEALKGFEHYANDTVDNTKGEAYYWIGRVYMAEKKYQEAGTYLLKSYKYYPANPKAASSLLYLARSLENLEKVDKACSVLDRLQAEYPNMASDEKQMATSHKRRLHCMKTN